MLTEQETQELNALRKLLDEGPLTYASDIVRLTQLERKDALDEAVRVTIYSAIIGELESLEHRGVYSGNGHHLAQRLIGLIREKMIKQSKLGTDSANGATS